MIIDTTLKYAFIHAEYYKVKGGMRALASRHGAIALEDLDHDDPAHLWTITPNGFIQSSTTERSYMAPQEGCVSVRMMSERPETPWTIVPVGDHPMKVRLRVDACRRPKVLRASFVSYFVDLEEDGFEHDASAWYMVPLHVMKPRHVR